MELHFFLIGHNDFIIEKKDFQEGRLGIPNPPRGLKKIPNWQ